MFTFVLMFFLLGLPVMFLELALGQYSGLGQSVMFDRLCPLFHGKLLHGFVISKTVLLLLSRGGILKHSSLNDADFAVYVYGK